MLCCQLCVAAQPLIHLHNHGGICTLLWAVDGAAPLLPAHGVGHVAGDAEGALLQLGNHVGFGNLHQILQALGPVGDLGTVFVQHTEAQSLEHTHATVVGGAAADAHDEMAAALSDGVPNHLPHAVGGGVQGVAFLLCHQSDTRRSRHLYNGGGSLLDDTVNALHRLAQRSGDQYLLRTAAHAQGQGFHRSLSAVGQGADTDLCIAHHPLNPGLDGLACLQGGEAALQRINGNNYFHTLHVPFCF